MTYHTTAKGLAALGRNGDSMLMHVNPSEVAALSKILGPTTTNPNTGLPEASNWSMLLGTLGGLATGVGGLGMGAAIADPAEEWAMNQFGEGLISDFLGKAAPVAAGAGLGAAIGGATGGKYGALGGAVQGGLAGGLGGMESENILGTTTPEGAAGQGVRVASSDPLKTDVGGTLQDEWQRQASGFTPNDPGVIYAEEGTKLYGQNANITPENIQAAGPKPGVMDNLSKYGDQLGSWKSLKKLGSDYGSALFTTGMLGQGIAGMGTTDDAYHRMKQRQQLEDLQQQMSADEAYKRLYGGRGIGVSYADGGPVKFSLPGPTPISMTIPENMVDQVYSAGGIGNLVQQHGFANGGYINTQQVNPENFYPQSQMPKAQPYAAASPIRHEVINNFASGGFIDGEGDGMSDDVDADIEGEEPVRVADGEFVIPRHLVDMLGGSDRLDELLKEVRRRSYGTEKQIQQDAAKQAAMDVLGAE